MKRTSICLVIMFSMVVALPCILRAASVGDYKPDIAYDAIGNRYLAVFQRIEATGIDIYGQFLDADGIKAGSEFMISALGSQPSNPTAAYDPINQKYLVAWDDLGASSDNDIFGQLVNADGSLDGSKLEISAVAGSGQSSPSLAFDSANQRFLVVWSDARGGLMSSDIYGQFVTSAGLLVDGSGQADPADIPLATGGNDMYTPAISYDPINSRYLVVWSGGIPGATTISGKLLNDSGGTVRDNFPVSNTLTLIHSNPAITFDDINERYFVVWSSSTSLPVPEYFILGQLVQADGTLFDQDGNLTPDPNGDNITIASDTVNTLYISDVAFDRRNNEYLVVWQIPIPTFPDDIAGYYVDPGGILKGNEIRIFNTATLNETMPAVAANTLCGSILMYYEVYDTVTYEIASLLLGTPACPNNASGASSDGGGGGCFIATARCGMQPI